MPRGEQVFIVQTRWINGTSFDEVFSLSSLFPSTVALTLIQQSKQIRNKTPILTQKLTAPIEDMRNFNVTITYADLQACKFTIYRKNIQ